MQASDIILGLLIIFLVGWTIIIAVQQQAIASDLRALEAKQVAQGIQMSPEKCPERPGQRLVRGTELEEEQYLTTVGFDSNRSQVYFCFYE